MDQNTARIYDTFLNNILQLGDYISHEKLFETGHETGISTEQVRRAIITFTGDDLLHELVMAEGGVIYRPGKKLHNFIIHHGGYSELQTVKKYERENVTLTWYRHWVWFIVSILSLTLNVAQFFLKD